MLDRFVDLARQIGGFGAGTAGVGENMGVEEAGLAQEGRCFCKISLGFLREPDDDVGRQAEDGEGGPEPLDGFTRHFGRIGAAHEVEDMISAALEREVEVRAKAMELGMHMVVESETLQPDGISEVKRCMNFLRSLEK